MDQLLGAPIIPNGSGYSQATAVVEALDQWECKEQVVAQVSDTVGTNTGYNKGAAHYIELKLGRKLIYLACRHHLLEIIPKHLFDKLIEKSTSPELGALCKKFETSWPNFDQTAFSPATDDDDLSDILTPTKVEEIVSFVLTTLQVKKPFNLEGLEWGWGQNSFILQIKNRYFTYPSLSEVKNAQVAPNHPAIIS